MNYTIEYVEPQPMERFPNHKWHVYSTDGGWIMLESKHLSKKEAQEWIDEHATK